MRQYRSGPDAVTDLMPDLNLRYLFPTPEEEGLQALQDPEKDSRHHLDCRTKDSVCISMRLIAIPQKL